MLAVSNENDDSVAYGTVTLIRHLKNIEDGKAPSLTTIPMDMDAENGWDDDYVLRRGLHMPLTYNALTYWDEYSPIAHEANFSSVREKYRSSLFLHQEMLAWNSPEETELLVNLQQNNGLIRIDVANNRALALAGYGLKDHGEIPVDINSNDKKCNLQTYPNLFAMRNPDSITTLRYNGRQYLLVANEGDDADFEEYEDAIEATDLFLVSRGIQKNETEWLRLYCSFG